MALSIVCHLVFSTSVISRKLLIHSETRELSDSKTGQSLKGRAWSHTSVYGQEGDALQDYKRMLHNCVPICAQYKHMHCRLWLCGLAHNTTKYTERLQPTCIVAKSIIINFICVAMPIHGSLRKKFGFSLYMYVIYVSSICNDGIGDCHIGVKRQPRSTTTIYDWLQWVGQCISSRIQRGTSLCMLRTGPG